ncbi:arginyl-tRNA synthetase [Cylindrobasidium torrendii FP15055 ss-10]|uniref:arginine--tRNA ligase n=1 Tax=Cylindrobasidium torrendii FP15055 ss-10 TaxID=1314674 RepID=A0A0D7BK72_9AGAR|nr:arginyl-tRNA synthetase [Cylindrobasidium torrendii FP15055 ss-10]
MSSSGPEPSASVLDVFRQSVAEIIARSLEIPIETAYDGVDLGKKGVDFTVAIPRFRRPGKPQELGKKIEQEFSPNDYLERLVVDGVFAHFYCNSKALTRLTLDQINELSRPTESAPFGTYGCNSSGRGKKVVIEFSSPNIAKPFHAGHLRSTIIGTFLSNLYSANGWETIRMNYLGDWGKQFGLLAVAFAKYGSEEKLAANPIMHLFDIYVAINKDVKEQEATGHSSVNEEAKDVFRRMEQGDTEMLALWRRFRELSIEAYKKVYQRLNITFDVYSGESLVTTANIDASMQRLRNSNLLVEKFAWESKRDRDYNAVGQQAQDEKPAYAVDLSKWKMSKPVVQKADGTTIYMVRDIAGAMQRYQQYHFDKMIYVVGDQQDLHCQQFFKILELMGEPYASSLQHINFGKVQGMSTRNGEVKFLDEILDMAKEAMLAQMKTNEDKFSNVEDPDFTSDQIGMTCVKIQDMQAKRAGSYPFDVKRMTSFEGDTGAYLQYAHVRLCSVARKVADETTLREDVTTINTDLLVEPKAREVVYHLATYPDAVRMALRVSEPSTIVTYCFRLSHLISSAWETLVVKGQDPEVAQARLYLFTCARHVLSSAMRLLSLTPLERM